jgi:hypothetical protein
MVHNIMEEIFFSIPVFVSQYACVYCNAHEPL